MGMKIYVLIQAKNEETKTPKSQSRRQNPLDLQVFKTLSNFEQKYKKLLFQDKHYNNVQLLKLQL